MKVFDLTHLITKNMPVYPGTEKPRLDPANTYEKDGFRETLLTMYSHTGTHVDPPGHIIKGGKMLDEFSASSFIGKALVIDVKYRERGEFITLSDLKPYEKFLEKVDFLLFNLGWDKLWGTPEYFGDYPVVDDEVLDFIISKNYKGIGFDVIGLDPISDEKLVRHNKLFRERDILNIENLKDLDLIAGEVVNFAVLPLKYESSDGAPVRAIAWKD